MSEPFLNVKPSFVLAVMDYSSTLNSESEVIEAFNKIKKKPKKILDNKDVEKIQEEDQIPEHLQELSRALEGAVTDI